jgi:hypothetical protein
MRRSKSGYREQYSYREGDPARLRDELSLWSGVYMAVWSRESVIYLTVTIPEYK